MKIRLFEVGVSASLFAVDEILKSRVEEKMETGTEMQLTEQIMLRKVHNKGMSLNLLSEKPELVKWLSTGVTLIVSGAQLMLCRKKGHSLEKAGLTLVSAGAWSNTWDRWMRSYVVDYIGFGKVKEKFRHLTYNLGDFFIGAGCLLWLLGVNGDHRVTVQTIANHFAD
nr:signal peptidase II [uncultured Mediterraneibacter sp.]